MHWSDCCLALSHWLIYRSVVYNSWILTMWRPIGVNSPGGIVVTGRVHMIGVCVHSRVKEHVWCCRWRGTAHVLWSRQHVRSRGDPMTMALAGVGGYSVHHGDACHYCYTHTRGLRRQQTGLSLLSYPTDHYPRCCWVCCCIEAADAQIYSLRTPKCHWDDRWSTQFCKDRKKIWLQNDNTLPNIHILVKIVNKKIFIGVVKKERKYGYRMTLPQQTYTNHLPKYSTKQSIPWCPLSLSNKKVVWQFCSHNVQNWPKKINYPLGAFTKLSFSIVYALQYLHCPGTTHWRFPLKSAAIYSNNLQIIRKYFFVHVLLSYFIPSSIWNWLPG